MDGIKREVEVDPLAAQSCDDADAEEDGDLALRPQTTLEPNYAFAVDHPEPDTFPVVKQESKEGTFGVIAVKEENKVAATKEEYEVLTESSWNVDENEMPEVKDPSSENCLAPENSSSGSASDARSYNEELGRETSLQSDSHSNSLMCDICGINLPIAHSLGMHLRKHDGERKFKCDICGKCFSRSGSHKEHLRRHTGEEPLKCDKCGKYFSNSEVLVSHACTYKGEKAFKCDVCGKCFSYSGNLIAHTRTHNGEKPFKCDYCGKCFSLLRSLDNHVRTHTSEKPR
ncbi:zinc finger and BTB domain-containing protein 49-like [Periplaneta americana]|uniref:zinc finger and BTB domain-containing protein 49-like n=1 Tax=Periplaneta americana TaxID=6978 RepID=UPI0037E97BB3